MKDSGIEWIGQIPENWKLERLQWHIDEIKINNNPVQTKQVLSLTNKLGVIPYEEKGAQGNTSKEDYSQYKLAYPHTIVANSMNILIGSVGVCDYFGCVSPVYYVYKPRIDSTLRFFNYIFQSQPFQKELRCYANGILEIRLRVSSNDILKREVAIPPLNEQQRIMDVLEEKSSMVDSIISNQEQQIEKLKAYKQSLITEVVTKGLNPNVPMKDSGVDWMKKMPAHWNTVLLSSIVSQRKNKNTGMQENNLLSLSYGNVIRKNIKSSDGLLPENFEGYNIIEKGDIILRLTDLQNDHTSLRTGLCTEKGIITSAYVTLNNRTDLMLSEYLHYYLHSFDIYKGFYGMGSGVRQGLTFDGIKKLVLMLPPLEEQQEIVEYLDSKCSQIDKLIEIKQEKIEKLEQYKKSLIYEYVTGKKEAI